MTKAAEDALAAADVVVDADAGLLLSDRIRLVAEPVEGADLRRAGQVRQRHRIQYCEADGAELAGRDLVTRKLRANGLAVDHLRAERIIDRQGPAGAIQ